MGISIYEDDERVGQLTRAAFERVNSRLLQIHRFAKTDIDHANRLLEIFDPPHGSVIADVGCGVGWLAKLMHIQRPDLSFILINKSRSQLAMGSGFVRIHGTAEELPLATDQVDAIMVTYVLGHVDLKAFVKECVRVNPKQIYIYDLFVRKPKRGCRLKSDLDYTERTINQTRAAFKRGGFGYRSIRHCGDFIPEDIERLLPSSETLNNTVSAALVLDQWTKLHTQRN